VTDRQTDRQTTKQMAHANDTEARRLTYRITQTHTKQTKKIAS